MEPRPVDPGLAGRGPPGARRRVRPRSRDQRHARPRRHPGHGHRLGPGAGDDHRRGGRAAGQPAAGATPVGRTRRRRDHRPRRAHEPAPRPPGRGPLRTHQGRTGRGQAARGTPPRQRHRPGRRRPPAGRGQPPAQSAGQGGTALPAGAAHRPGHARDLRGRAPRRLPDPDRPGEGPPRRSPLRPRDRGRTAAGTAPHGHRRGELRPADHRAGQCQRGRGGSPPDGELAVARAHRDRLAVLLLASAREDPAHWQLRGALLTEIDRVLDELGVDKRSQRLLDELDQHARTRRTGRLAGWHRRWMPRKSSPRDGA